MANPRSASTRRAILSYDRYKSLYREATPSIVLPELLIKDYPKLIPELLEKFGYKKDATHLIHNCLHMMNQEMFRTWLLNKAFEDVMKDE